MVMFNSYVTNYQRVGGVIPENPPVLVLGVAFQGLHQTIEDEGLQKAILPKWWRLMNHKLAIKNR